MKQYEVRMAITVAVTVTVEAENDEQAEQIAMQKTGENEAYWLKQYDSVWDREVAEINECKDNESINE